MYSGRLTQVAPRYGSIRAAAAFRISDPAASFCRMASERAASSPKRAKDRLRLPGHGKAAPEGSRRDGPCSNWRPQDIGAT